MPDPKHCARQENCRAQMFYDRGSYAFAAGTLAKMVSVKARMIEFLT